MCAIIWLIYTILEIAFYVVLAHVIMSWLINFNILDMRQPIVQQIWRGISNLLEPLYRPLRRVLPDLGGIDLAPLIIAIAILFLQRLLVSDIARLLNLNCG